MPSARVEPLPSAAIAPRLVRRLRVRSAVGLVLVALAILAAQIGVSVAFLAHRDHAQSVHLFEQQRFFGTMIENALDADRAGETDVVPELRGILGRFEPMHESLKALPATDPVILAASERLLGRLRTVIAARPQHELRKELELLGAARLDYEATAGELVPMLERQFVERMRDLERIQWIITIVSVGLVAAIGLLVFEPIARMLQRALGRLEANERSLARLALVAERTGSAVALATPDGRIEWVNRAFERLTGYSVADLAAGRLTHLLGCEASDPKVVERLRSAAHDAHAANEHLVLRRRDGRRFWARIELQPAWTREGVLSGTIAILADITDEMLERARREADRASSELRLAVLRMLQTERPFPERLEGSLDAIARHAGAGLGTDRIRHVAVWAPRDGAWRVLASAGATFDDRGSPVEEPRASCAAVEVALRAIGASTTVLLRGDDAIGVLVTTFQEREAVSIGRDPDHRWTEEAAALAELLSEAMIREEARLLLEAARRTSEQTTAAKARFLATMSHEIRTPMTAIVGFSELLADPGLSPAEQASHIATIRHAARHLLGIVNDVLDLSKIEAGALAIDVVPVSTVAVLHEVAMIMRPRADEKGLAFTITGDGELPASFRSDPVRIRQILLNLLGNAIKFTDKGGVRLVARVEGDLDGGRPFVVFEVSDSGPGVPQDMRARIFEPFGQVDADGERRSGGTGLGLTISRHLATLLGGALELVESSSAGSTFALRVPARERHGSVVFGAWRVDASQLPPSTDLMLRGVILLVEDNPDNQRLLAYHLRRAGATVNVVDDGKAALDAVEIAEPDLVLMDMQMPGLDGYAATRALRKRGYRGPIIAVTAHAVTDDGVRCVEAGCDAVLTKPVMRTTLLAACDRALRGEAIGVRAAQRSS
jgi:PAS domain S-box-containing protein